ncbi:MAG TPA: UvrD-helicase domain-containing protein [Selenomonadales bacterium]|nr:UvrD-helicase domain-containing protein [Selenomonadales bacterium]
MAEFTEAQERAIRTLDANVAVSAGAGAGKTKVLVERYIHLLAEGRAETGGILAITFTNKAAKEMKERIRARAAELAETAGSGAERQRWRDIRAEVEAAPIGTFHSFCGRVLRDNPVEAGLDPGFAVLDEAETELLLEKALAEVLAAGLSEGADWLDRLLGAYEQTALTELTKGLYDRLAGLGWVKEGLAERLAVPYGRAAGARETLQDELRTQCLALIAGKDQLNPAGAQYSRIAALERDWEAVSTAIGKAVAEAAADRVLARYLDGLDRRSKDKELVAAVKETLKNLRRVRADLAAAELVPAWCRLLSALHRRLAEHKAENRVLTFNDLEVRAAELLGGNPDVRRRYQNRLRQIMVDEFQDTNELQRQVVYLLAGGDAGRLSGSKLFVVGDAKQSIYRFRGADVAVFERVKADIAASGGVLVELDVNFRSAGALLAVYNECFAAMMGTAQDVIPFRPLLAHRQEGEVVRAEFMPVARDSLTAGETARQAEAGAIARRIRRMVDGCERLVGQGEAARPVCYGDIAVLFRTIKDMEVYTAALQAAAIPFCVVGGQGFYQRQEIRDILNLLKVIDNRFRETALAGVLRSPLFLLADSVLLRLRQAGSSLWHGLERHASLPGLSDEDRQAAERAWRILEKLRGLRGLVGLSELVERALTETCYPEFVLTQFMGRQQYANLLKLAAAARQYEAKGPAALGDFLRYVDRLVAGEVKEGEAQIETEDSDAVRLMTIHKSKGLEFPVVFVPDLHRKFKEDHAAALFNPELGLGLKVPGEGGELSATSVYEEVAGREKQLAVLELKRVLYVAMTRARDYLVLSGAGDKLAAEKDYTELNTWLGWLGKVYGLTGFEALPDRLAVNKAPVLVQACPDQLPAAACTEGVPCSRDSRPWRLETVKGNIAPLPVAAAAPRPFTATDIVKFRHCRRAFYYHRIAGLPEGIGEFAASDKTGRPSGPLTGTALHRCLELLEPGLAWEECLEQALEETVPGEWREAVRLDARPLIRSYVEGALYREIAPLPTLREWHFSYYLDPGTARAGVFTGRLDCLTDYPDGTCGIVDYKTDQVTAGAAAAKAREYAGQLTLYSLAVEAVLKKPVRDARLFFLRAGVAVPVPVDQAGKAAAEQELRSLIGFVREHPRERDYPGNREWCSRCGYRLLCPEAPPG